MIVIHYPTAFKALDCFIDIFNGKTEKSTQRLKTGPVMTAKEIIRIYGISLLKANGTQEITRENIAPLQTNNRQLAKLVKCSARSIQRHLARLLEAGIITGKVFHGSNANYELFINPEILLIKDRLSVDKMEKQLADRLELVRQTEEKTPVLKNETPNCPHTYSCNTSNKKNNIIIAVNNGNRTGYAGEIVQDHSEKQFFKKNFEEAGEIVSRAAPSGDRNVPPDTARDNSLTLYTGLLWMMARNLLYNKVDLTDRQISTAKKLIQKLYEPVSTENLSRAHQQYVERIALVEKYIRKDPVKRFVMLPYLYFDVNNPHGFIGTQKWYQADQIRKADVQRELTVNRLIRSYQLNEKRETAKRKPKLKLFRECENTIGKFNNPALLQRFHAAVLNYETYKQISYTS